MSPQNGAPGSGLGSDPPGALEEPPPPSGGAEDEAAGPSSTARVSRAVLAEEESPLAPRSVPPRAEDVSGRTTLLVWVALLVVFVALGLRYFAR